MNFKKLTSFLITSLPLFLAPVLVSAQSMNFTYLNSFFSGLDGLFRNFLLPLLMAVAILIFVWNVLRYFIWSADDPTGRETARAYILYALMGLVLIVAVWGFVNLILGFFGLGTGTNLNNAPPLPQLP